MNDEYAITYDPLRMRGDIDDLDESHLQSVCACLIIRDVILFEANPESYLLISYTVNIVTDARSRELGR